MAGKQAVSAHFVGRFFGTLLASFAQLVRPPSHSRRAEAARRGAAGRESVARFDWATTLAPLMDVLRSLAA